MESLDLFHTRYEENYLRRELGVVVNDPIVALTELVANAHDAGASKVNIIVPEEWNVEVRGIPIFAGMKVTRPLRPFHLLRDSEVHM